MNSGKNPKTNIATNDIIWHGVRDVLGYSLLVTVLQAVLGGAIVSGDPFGLPESLYWLLPIGLFVQVMFLTGPILMPIRFVRRKPKSVVGMVMASAVGFLALQLLRYIF